MTDVPSKHVCENYLKSRIIFENFFSFNLLLSRQFGIAVAFKSAVITF